MNLFGFWLGVFLTFLRTVESRDLKSRGRIQSKKKQK